MIIWRHRKSRENTTKKTKCEATKGGLEIDGENKLDRKKLDIRQMIKIWKFL